MTTTTNATARREGSAARAPGSTTAVLLATAPTGDGRPAALLTFEGSALLSRLVRQLESLAVRRVEVLTRPQWADALRAAVADTGIRVVVRPCEDPAHDLRQIAAVAARARGPIVVAHADVVTQREALAGLLADPRVVTGILSTGRRRAYTFRVRSARGRVVSAGSPYHTVRRPTGTFLGFLKVDTRDRESLAEVATELAELCAAPPAEWLAELDRREARYLKSMRAQVLAAQGLDRVGPEDDGSLASADADVAAEEPLEGADAAAGDPTMSDVRAEQPDDDPLLGDEHRETVARRMELARANVPSMLVVGLVRRGVHLGNSYLRSLFWSRPLSVEAAEAAEERIGSHDEERALLASAVKASDSWFTTFLVSPYSKYVARWCARVGLTPNIVTTISMVIGIAAALAFATGTRLGLVVGAVLLQLAFTADCVDGQLARYTRTFSKLGAWLDSIFDRGKEYVVFAGLAVGASRGFGDDVWLLAGLAITLQTARHTVDFSYAARQHELIAAVPQLPLSQTSDRARSSAQREPDHHPAPAEAPEPAAPMMTEARPAHVAPPVESSPATAAPERTTVVTHASAGAAMAHRVTAHAGATVTHRVETADGGRATTGLDPSEDAVPLDSGAAADPRRDDREKVAKPPRARKPLSRRIGIAAVALSRRFERRPWMRWAKKILVLPIGERFAVISLTAALWTPRVTFVVLLAWGCLAAAYSVSGRVLRSMAA